VQQLCRLLRTHPRFDDNVLLTSLDALKALARTAAGAQAAGQAALPALLAALGRADAVGTPCAQGALYTLDCMICSDARRSMELARLLACSPRGLATDAPRASAIRPADLRQNFDSADRCGGRG
jgi:hypothetical protein